MLKQATQRGRRRDNAGGEIVFIRPPRAAGQSPPEVYAENFGESRMKLGKRHVLVRRGWEGEKVSVFSILLT
jgi:hypothetical protein